MNWLIPAMLALVSWGAWGVLSKLALDHYRWHEVMGLSSFVTLLFAAMFHITSRSSFKLDSPGLWITLATSVFGSLALVGFFVALEIGKASLVVPLTALYPAITVVLSVVFLKEDFTPLKGAGIVLAILAVVLLSAE